MAQSVHMKFVWQWRRDIMQGFSVKDISKQSGYSEALIRSYTKDERVRVKEQQKAAKNQAETQMLLREAHRQFG
jgi:hypothetical protein